MAFLLFCFVVVCWLGTVWCAYLVGRTDGIELQKRRSHRAWNRAMKVEDRTW